MLETCNSTPISIFKNIKLKDRNININQILNEIKEDVNNLNPESIRKHSRNNRNSNSSIHSHEVQQ